MSKFIWQVIAVFAILVYIKIGYIWLPIIWATSWPDAMIIGMGLCSLAYIAIQEQFLNDD